MSNKVNVKLNLKGINEVMKSEAIIEHLKEAGEQVAQAAGEGFEVDTEKLNYIGICEIRAESPAAEKACYEDNVLVKALSSSGLKMKEDVKK